MAEPIHLLIISNASGGDFVAGADRDWVNLLNALGPDEVRAIWVASSGGQLLAAAIDPRVLIRAIDLRHPCVYEVIGDSARVARSTLQRLGTATLRFSRLAITYLQLRRALRGRRVDVVVTNTAVPLLGAYVARRMGRPHVWNIKEYLDQDVAACRRHAAFMLAHSVAIVAPSRKIAEPFGARAAVLPDGTDLREVAAHAITPRGDVLKALGLPVDLPMVVQVGTLGASKGQRLTAEAFVRRAIRGGSPSCSLVFFGAGPSEEREQIAAVLARAPASWRAVVRFDVFRDRDLSALAAADVIVHPSMGHDAFPNAVREAMILGRPVIASAVGGLVDMIADGVSGCLIPAGDVEALDMAIDRLVQSPALRQQLGAAAQIAARERFDVHTQKLVFLGLLRRLAAPAAC